MWWDDIKNLTVSHIKITGCTDDVRGHSTHCCHASDDLLPDVVDVAEAAAEHGEQLEVGRALRPRVARPVLQPERLPDAALGVPDLLAQRDRRVELLLEHPQELVQVAAALEAPADERGNRLRGG